MMSQTEEMPDQSSESQVKNEIDNEDEHVAMYSPFGTIHEHSDSELEPESLRKRLKHKTRRRQTKPMSVGGATQKPRCEVCGKIYSCTSSLALHMKIHLEEKSHICEFCGQAFRRRHQLVLHELSVHQGIKPFICDVCGKGYTENRGLRNHMAVHNGVKDFKCGICGKTSWHKDGLKKHIHRVHVKATTSTMNRTATIRSDPCDVCGKTFVDTLTLTRHMYIHTGEKEASCSICKMEFARKSSLKLHMTRRHNPFIVKKKRGRQKKVNNVSDSDNSVKTIELSSKQLINGTTDPEKTTEKSVSEKGLPELTSVMKEGSVYSDSELIHNQSFDTDINMEPTYDTETDNTSHEVAVDRAQNTAELTAVIKMETDSANIEARTVTSEFPDFIKLEYPEVKVTVTVGQNLLPSVQIRDEFTAVEGEVDNDQLEPM